MRDEYSHLIATKLVKLIEYLLLCHRVKRRRRLVEDKNIRVAVKGSRDSELLPLTDRKLYTVLLEISHKRSVVSVGKTGDKVGGVCLSCGIGDLLLVHVLSVNVAEFNILGDTDRVFSEVLEDDAENTVELLDVVLLDVSSVKQYLALGGVVKSCQKLDKGGLSRTVKSDEDYGLSGTERQTYVLYYHSVAAGISKAYVAELYGMRLAVHYLLGCLYTRNDGLFLIDIGYKVIDKEGALVYRR